MVRCKKNGAYVTLSNAEFAHYAQSGDIDGIDPDLVFINGMLPVDNTACLFELSDAVEKACPPGNGE